jgi:NADPH:quinone reductase-like Zn-dependent oxidoreductase
MKAVICTRYGPPEVLLLKEIEKPGPRDHEILVRVKTTAVNTADWRIRKADPPIIRLFFGIFKPRVKILGGVLSGEIESVGKKVKRYKAGDQVFGSTGWKMGANAEFVCLPEKAVLAIRPNEISHEEAAAFPFGSFTALHYLKKAGIRTGQKIMIYGASGATGTAAVSCLFWC